MDRTDIGSMTEILNALAPFAGQTPPPPETTGSDIGALIFIAVFGLGFVALGWAFLRKKRQERLDVLAKASLEADEEHHLEDYISGKKKPAELTETTDGEKVPEAKAAEVVEAEKDAQKAKAAEERAQRDRERAEQEAAEAAAAAEDDAEKKAADEKLEQAREREAEAKAAAEQAQARAKQLRSALSKTRDGFIGRLSKALGGREIDESIVEDLESVLFTADIGTRTAEKLLDTVRDKLKAKELADADKVQGAIREEIVAMLSSVDVKPLRTDDGPSVLMILGVNGAGKTTTIGKLAHQLKSAGKSVVLGAGDTFRAAAGEQLEVWAERAGCEIVRSDKDGADPSSVLFDAVKKAKESGVDVVLCDTAGRLHTKVNLMEELKKVERVLGKASEGAPHEVLLVLDATVGQNAIQQAKQFGETVPLTGIVLTKLDGTAKGGVIIGIADELGVPVRYIGVGEKLDDLRPFDPEGFVAALFGDEPAEQTAAA
jgi:fused signal recognition particle receptor